MSHYRRYPAYKDSGIEWIGEAPRHWKTTRLKFVSSAFIGLTYDPTDLCDEQGGVLVLRASNIQNGSLDLQDCVYVSCAIPDSLRVKKGDILVCSRNGSKALIGKNILIDEQTEDVTFGAFMTIIRGDLNEFLYCVFNSDLFQAQSALYMTSTVNQLTLSILNDIQIALPPPDERIRISGFLKARTARIDALIAKKTRFTELLKEKRQALITHAVTKGLNPAVRMKDSGIEWIGKVPEHWEIVPPTALFTDSKERARDGDELLSATQKYGVIPLAEFESLEQRQVTKAVANLEIRKHVEVGDFVISMRSMDGGLERARAIGSVRSSYSVLKPGPDVDGRFFGALLKSSLYIQALRLTSNFIRDGQDLNFGHFRQVRLPKPSLQEQVTIADHLEAETSRIDTLISKTERSITLLKERRSALITAAVTGQIDLREAA